MAFYLHSLDIIYHVEVLRGWMKILHTSISKYLKNTTQNLIERCWSQVVLVFFCEHVENADWNMAEVIFKFKFFILKLNTWKENSFHALIGKTLSFYLPCSTLCPVNNEIEVTCCIVWNHKTSYVPRCSIDIGNNF